MLAHCKDRIYQALIKFALWLPFAILIIGVAVAIAAICDHIAATEVCKAKLNGF